MNILYDMTVEHGRPTCGAEPPVRLGKAPSLNFQISDVVPVGDGDNRTYRVLGIRKKETEEESPVPAVVQATTRDGLNFECEETLFAAPAGPHYYVYAQEVAVARNDGRLLLMGCEAGRPASAGHFFHAFGADRNGPWRALSETCVYRGQDAFGVVWNQAQNCWVNYQTTYQPYPKHYADNMKHIRRVLHIRTSPDGVTWTPGGSFGTKGPYLPEEQMIMPDAEDHPDTEFYKFKPFFHRGMWIGPMVKYTSQPPIVDKAEQFPHGPFMEIEWWVSRDGFSWQRPFRESSHLDAVPLFLCYFMHPPIVVDGELRWVTDQEVYALQEDRMFYLHARHNTEIVTNTFVLENATPQLQVAFGSPTAERQGALYQGYVMAELLTPDGRVIPGCERASCLHHASTESMLPLHWGDGSVAQSFLGKSVRLRLLMRDVKLYAVGND